MGVCFSAADTCSAAESSAGEGGGSPALSFGERYKLFAFGLIFYIFFAFWVFDVYLVPTILPYWGWLPVVLVNAIGVLALGSLYKTKTMDPGYLKEDWVRPGYPRSCFIIRT